MAPHLHPIARIPKDLVDKPECRLIVQLRDIEPATAPQLALRLGLKTKHVSASLRQREGVGSVMRCGMAPASGNRDATLWRTV